LRGGGNLNDRNLGGEGFLAGMFLVDVQLLQRYGYVGAVNCNKLGNDTSTQVQHWASNVDVTNVQSHSRLLCRANPCI
jgi:hypothetical protein